MDIPMNALLLQGIPEGTAITTLAFVISDIPLKLNKILLIGTALSVCAYVVRLFPIPFGIHTISSLFLLFIVLTMLSKGDIGLSFMASLLSHLALVIIETACLTLLMSLFDKTPKTLFTYPADRVVVGNIHVLLLFICAFLLNKLYFKRVT